MEGDGLREQKKMLRRKVKDKLVALTSEEIENQCPFISPGFTF